MIGKTLNHYEVLGSLGEGGMGEVYRATDQRLKRDVAIKLLPPELAGDPERLARLEREAQLLAQLEHPNVATVYGLEEAQDPPVRFLVMQLVEGDTLADRVTKGAGVGRSGGLPLAESLEIAGQVAAGLEAAHDRGIVHRDLKPANVMLAPDGGVKILDFGLAKAFTDDGSGTSVELSASPTMMAATRTGMILGTAGYMSPEQARGKAVDKRTDVWAFGCVLYEMLAGRRLFDGETVSDVMASILKDEPSLDVLANRHGPRLIHLLERCLTKDPQRRLRDIGEARIEIAGLLEDPEETIAVATEAAADPRSRRRERLAWVAALAVVAAVAAFAASSLRVPDPRPAVAFELTLPGDLEFRREPPAVSPDGGAVVFVAGRVGEPPQLWLRELNESAVRPLAGTDGASYPFWSPDGRNVAYFVSDTLHRIDVSGGLARKLAEDGGGRSTGSGRGGSWNENGDILFGVGGSGVHRVSDAGGVPTPATEPPDGFSDIFPRFLPDGDRFVFSRVIRGNPSENSLMIASLSGRAPTTVLQNVSSARFVEPGHLFFRRDQTVFGQAFDPDDEELGDETFVVLQGVDEWQAETLLVGASAEGVLVFAQELASRGVVPTWFGQDGTSLGEALPEGDYAVPVLSPDGTRLAVHASPDGDGDAEVYVFDLETKVATRLTVAGGAVPVWSPDGARIAFGRNAVGFDRDIALISSSAPGEGQMRLTTKRTRRRPTGLLTGSTCCSTRFPRREATCWPFRSMATARRFRSRRPNSGRATRRSRLMVIGSCTQATCLARCSFTCGRFRPPTM